LKTELDTGALGCVAGGEVGWTVVAGAEKSKRSSMAEDALGAGAGAAAMGDEKSPNPPNPELELDTFDW
jgi:hypothetical protein